MEAKTERMSTKLVKKDINNTISDFDIYSHYEETEDILADAKYIIESGRNAA